MNEVMAEEPILVDSPETVPVARRASVVRSIDDERQEPTGKTQLHERVIVRHSEELDQLVAALAIAQGSFDDLARTQTADVESRRTGAKYQYDYETLSDVIHATRKSLSDNGLAVMQFPFPGRESITIRTMVAHKSGQWIYNDLSASLSSLDPQSIGSGITYLMRYARKAILGLSAGYQDDDGAAASKGVKAKPQAPEGYEEWIDDLRACADEGLERLRETWTKSRQDYRRYLTSTAPDEWMAIKAQAAQVKQTAEESHTVFSHDSLPPLPDSWKGLVK